MLINMCRFLWCVHLYSFYSALVIRSQSNPLPWYQDSQSESREQAVRNERVSYLHVAPL